MVATRYDHDDADGAPRSRSAGRRPKVIEQCSRGAVALHRAALAVRQRAPARTDLIDGGLVQSKILLLISGWATRYRLLSDGRRQILDVLLPGDLIGVDDFLVGDSPDFVMTLTDVGFGSLDYDSFQQLIDQPEIALHVLSSGAVAKRRIDDHLAMIGQLDAEERVAAMLLGLQGRLRDLRLVEGNSFYCPLTQQEMADLLGVTVVHINRVLKRLREKDVVLVRSHTVVVHDMPKLLALASGRARSGMGGKIRDTAFYRPRIDR